MSRFSEIAEFICENHQVLAQIIINISFSRGVKHIELPPISDAIQICNRLPPSCNFTWIYFYRALLGYLLSEQLLSMKTNCSLFDDLSNARYEQLDDYNIRTVRLK